MYKENPYLTEAQRKAIKQGENKDVDFLKQLRKDLVIEIIRRRSAEVSADAHIIYKLTIAQEAEILALYITGKTSIDPEKLIEVYNNM